MALYKTDFMFFTVHVQKIHKMKSPSNYYPLNFPAVGDPFSWINVTAWRSTENQEQMHMEKQYLSKFNSGKNEKVKQCVDGWCNCGISTFITSIFLLSMYPDVDRCVPQCLSCWILSTLPQSFCHSFFPSSSPGSNLTARSSGKWLTQSFARPEAHSCCRRMQVDRPAHD